MLFACKVSRRAERGCEQLQSGRPLSHSTVQDCTRKSCGARVSGQEGRDGRTSARQGSCRSCEVVGSCDVSAGHRDLAFPRVYLRDLRAFDHGAPPQGDSRIVLRGTLYPTASTEQTPHFSTFCSHLWETDSAADATHIFGARHHRHVVTTPLTDGRLHTAAHRHLSPRPHATPRTAAPRTPLCHFSTHPSTEHPLIAS